MGFVAGFLIGLGGTWLARRLWPAIASEPTTWFGEDWQEQLLDRAINRIIGAETTTGNPSVPSAERSARPG